MAAGRRLPVPGPGPAAAHGRRDRRLASRHAWPTAQRSHPRLHARRGAPRARGPRRPRRAGLRHGQAGPRDAGGAGGAGAAPARPRRGDVDRRPGRRRRAPWRPGPRRSTLRRRTGVRLRRPDARHGEAPRLPRGDARARPPVGRALLAALRFRPRLRRRRRHQRHARAARPLRFGRGGRLQPGSGPSGGGTVTPGARRACGRAGGPRVTAPAHALARRARTGTRPSRAAAGLGLGGVLVAIGSLAVVAAALIALQAASLRATRTAQVTRDLAVAAEAESRLLAAAGAAGEACRVATRWPAVARCRVETLCDAASCRPRVHRVVVAAPDGRELAVVGAGPRDDAMGVAAAGGEASP